MWIFITFYNLQVFYSRIFSGYQIYKLAGKAKLENFKYIESIQKPLLLNLEKTGNYFIHIFKQYLM